MRKKRNEASLQENKINPISAEGEDMHEEIRIPVVEEQVQVRTEQVETGRVHVSKSITERQEEVAVPVAYEQVQVERVAINRYVDEAPPGVRFEGEIMIIPVLKEELVVTKRLLLVEELRIRKQVVDTTEKQEVLLRQEHVRVSREQPEGGPAPA